MAPLMQLLAPAERFDAWLMIDDAHGFGVLGPQGRGTLALAGIVLAGHPRPLYMGTLGKAAGVSGAFVAGAENVIEWLLQRARTYSFTTASSPIVATTLIKSLELIATGAARRSHLQILIVRRRAGLQHSAWQLLPSPTAIHVIVIGENDAPLRIAAALAEQGIWVPAIRPPTVAAGAGAPAHHAVGGHSIADVDSPLNTLKALQ